MNLLSLFAIYFIVWWVTLFAVLPLGVTTHDVSEGAVGGTRGSAPQNPRMGFKVLLTTVVATVITGIFYLLTSVLGFTVDDIPRIVPEFSRGAG